MQWRVKLSKKYHVRDCLLILVGAAAVLAGTCLGHAVHNPLPLKPETKTVTAAWVPATVKQWDSLIAEMSQKYDIDPNLVAIIITMESGGYAKAESEAGAQGLMQVTPPTAGDIAKKYLKEPLKTYDLMDPRTNIEFGTAYLAYLRDEFGAANQGPTWISTVELIAAGYNGGPGAANDIEQGKGLTDTQTVVYSRDAFNMWRERKSKKSPTFDRWKERGGSLLIEKAQAEQH